jgi:hypothetical protein
MTTYQVISASAVSRTRNRYPKLAWPVDALAIGEAFIVPLRDGCDPDGRPEAYVRVLADKAARRLGRKFACNKVDGEGLAISRIA